MACRAPRPHEKTYTPYTLSDRPTPSVSCSPDLSTETALPDLSTESDVSLLILDKPGFPTYAEYKKLEGMYYNKLSLRKREKALITQSMFDQIWDVLESPGSTQIGSPQFRFWVRKMFHLSEPSVNPLRGEEEGQDRMIPVVMHGDKAVAIREQLYDLLCFCHARSRHAGRDRTCAVIRQHYSWVPKELVALFVKHCPTCELKKNGIGNHTGVDITSPNNASGQSNGETQLKPGESHRSFVPWARSKLSSSTETPASSSTPRDGLPLPPLMTREASISMYDGTHNGWPAYPSAGISTHETYLTRIAEQNILAAANTEMTRVPGSNPLWNFPPNCWNHPLPTNANLISHLETDRTPKLRSLPSLPQALSCAGNTNSNDLPPLQTSPSHTGISMSNFRRLLINRSNISSSTNGDTSASSTIEDREDENIRPQSTSENALTLDTSYRKTNRFTNGAGTTIESLQDGLLPFAPSMNIRKPEMRDLVMNRSFGSNSSSTKAESGESNISVQQNLNTSSKVISDIGPLFDQANAFVQNHDPMLKIDPSTNFTARAQYLENPTSPMRVSTGRRAPPPSPLNFTHSSNNLRFRPSVSAITSQLNSLSSSSSSFGHSKGTDTSPTTDSAYSSSSSTSSQRTIYQLFTSTSATSSSAATPLTSGLPTPTEELADQLKLLGGKPSIFSSNDGIPVGEIGEDEHPVNWAIQGMGYAFTSS